MEKLLTPPRVFEIRRRHANHLLNYKSRQKNYLHAEDLIERLETELCKYSSEIGSNRTTHLKSRIEKLESLIHRGEKQIIPHYVQQREMWHKRIAVQREKLYSEDDPKLQSALSSDLRRLWKQYNASDQVYIDARDKLWGYRDELRHKQRMSLKIKRAQGCAQQLSESEKRLRNYLQDIIKLRQVMLGEQANAQKSLDDQTENINRCRAAIARHKEGIEQLRKAWENRKGDMRIRHDAGVKIVTMACEDLIKYRKIEAGISIATLAAGFFKALAEQAFKEGWKAIVLWGLVQAMKDQGQNLAVNGVVATYDAVNHPVWAEPIKSRNVSTVYNSAEWRQKIEYEAAVEARTVRIGGFTEMGAKLFGDQYDTLKMGYAELSRASLEGMLWEAAIKHERQVVTAGEKLLEQLKKRRKGAEVEYKTIAKINAAIVKDDP